MSKLSKLLNLLVAVTVIACTHSSAIEKQDCLDNLQIAQGFKPYNGEALGCHFFIDQYECNDELLFVLNNQCADILYKVIDCDNNDVTDRYGDKIFNQKGKIVAIKED